VATGPPRPPGGRAHTDDSRAQTTLDFAIGVSLFLSVMLFVFAFVPGILQPFELSGEQDTVLSERIASDLSQGTLGDPSEPYVLETHCTVAFFDEGSASPSRCDYEGSTIQERLTVEDHRNVNVSLRGTLSGADEDLLCWDATSQRIVERGSGDCNPDAGDDDRLMTGGETPPQSNDATVSSRRVVGIQQANITMRVVVW